MSSTTTEGQKPDDSSNELKTISESDQVERTGIITLSFTRTVDHLPLAEQTRVGNEIVQLLGEFVGHFRDPAGMQVKVNNEVDGQRVVSVEKSVELPSTDRETIARAISLRDGYIKRMEGVVRRKEYEQYSDTPHHSETETPRPDECECRAEYTDDDDPLPCFHCRLHGFDVPNPQAGTDDE